MSAEDEFYFGLKGKVKGGRLEKWTPDTLVSEGKYVMGCIYDSPAGKFEDGDTVSCSRTIKIHEKDGKPYILETKHSYYYLGKRGCEEQLNEHYMRFYKDRDDWM